MEPLRESEVASGDGVVVVSATGGQPSEFTVEVHFENGQPRDDVTAAEVGGHHVMY